MKTINCMGSEIELTTERRQRVVCALVETQGKLERELRHGDLQDKKKVDFYEEHIKNLEDMLS